MTARCLPLVICIGVMSLASSRPVPAAEDAAPQPGKVDAVQTEANDAEPSAEEVARRFFVALLTRDEATIKRYSIPAPGSDILWRGAAVNDEARDVIKERIADMKFRRLKAGDTVKSPDGKEYVIESHQVNEGRVLLLPEGFKLPFTLIHSDLGWRVKVDGLVAARKAAAKAEDDEPAEAEGKQ